MPIDTLPPLRDVIHRFDLKALKAFGQNYLFDLNLTSRIARSAGITPDITVIEVGPGPGGLTRAILALSPRKIIVIEKDPRFIPALEEISAHYPGRMTIMNEDALSIDWSRFSEHKNIKIVSNLPYNVGTELLTRWIGLEPWPPFYQSMTLMFQREVARRIVATPEDPRDYGRLAVFSTWRTEARLLFDVSPSAFIPPPKVKSSIVHLVPRTNPLPCLQSDLEAVTRNAFGQRRKMLRQSLKGMGIDPTALLADTDIDETARAETLSVMQFVTLAQRYHLLKSGTV
ncbi:MAG: 16S rRNA (adenine(1518)-N(6)/adenine(1519)-N(6))-dimethyltransferase RsmA [Hyphomicrobiales bacterium]